MSKLYPPQIVSLLPAFAKNSEGNIELQIKYEDNPSVSTSHYSDIKLIMRAAQDNSLIANLKANINETNKINKIAKFDLSSIEYKLIVGNYYLIQLAYIHMAGQEGYYSSISTIKYTTYPVGTVVQASTSSMMFKSIFTQEGQDISEKLYSVIFELYKTGDAEPMLTSGEILHNTSTDFNLEQIDTYDFGFITSNETASYYCTVKYTTLNGLSGAIESIANSFEKFENADFNYPSEYLAESGIFKFQFLASYPNSNSISFQAKIFRKDNTLNNKLWYLLNENCASHIFYDNTVEYGHQYEYQAVAILGSDEKIVCPKDQIENIGFQTYFDNMILSDSHGITLPIKYNPTVNTFKNIVLENKVDTIGSQYPFIYRNGNVNYKEMAIGGLISYTMDVDNLFSGMGMPPASSRLSTPAPIDNLNTFINTTNLSDDNIKRELDFKLKVMNWLNNGEPKLLRSPTEGTYLVRLMNVSLTPEKALGRLVHSFAATAYEIDEHDIQTLKKYGFYGG